MSTSTRRPSTGRRISSRASYVAKAACHSDQTADGCWRWVGLIHNGTPHVNPHPDSGHRGVINIRRELLIETGVERPAGAGPAIVVCGTSDCVRPDHLDWTPPEEHALRRRVAARASVTIEQLREAQRRRARGEPVGAIAADLGISRQGLYRQWSRWLDAEGITGA